MFMARAPLLKLEHYIMSRGSPAPSSAASGLQLVRCPVAYNPIGCGADLTEDRLGRGEEMLGIKEPERTEPNLQQHTPGSAALRPRL